MIFFWFALTNAKHLDYCRRYPSNWIIGSKSRSWCAVGRADRWNRGAIFR